MLNLNPMGLIHRIVGGIVIAKKNILAGGLASLHYSPANLHQLNRPSQPTHSYNNNNKTHSRLLRRAAYRQSPSQSATRRQSIARPCK